MTKKNDLPTLFHQILFPVVMIGLCDLKISDEEMADFKATAKGMGTWFDMDAEESLKVAQETYTTVKTFAQNGQIKDLFNTALTCCAIINQRVEDDEIKEDIIRLLNDQANADGTVTDFEENTLALYSSIIRMGGEAFGIKI
jgi:hypothetical protein